MVCLLVCKYRLSKRLVLDALSDLLGVHLRPCVMYRLGLLIQVRKLLGPDLWRKLEAALHEAFFQAPLYIRGTHVRGPPPTGR
ncbi:hypothetical protein ACN28E_13940 [Archangium lansingense]|uniref:hypothetical protein n=1 Tax=Archangium lansingense TaxID=2995310 RepID=UPI003B7C89C0